MKRIIQGGIKNSYDQSNDDRLMREVQTEEIVCEDFENQCPEDYFHNFQKKTEDFFEDFESLAHTQKFLQFSIFSLIYLILKKYLRFINNAAPLIEEILAKKETNKPVKKQQKQTEIFELPLAQFLSAYKTQLVDVFLDLDENNTIFVLYAFPLNNQTCSLIIEYINLEPAKVFFSDTLLVKINKYDTTLFAGSNEGAIILWDLRFTDSFYKNKKNINESFKIEDKFPSEISLRTPNFSSESELIYNPSTFSHKAAISKILINFESSQSKEILSLDILNQLIIWRIVELNQTEMERNYINYGSRAKMKLIQIMQINLSDIFAESLLEQHQSILNINNFEIDVKDNMIYFCSNTKIIKSDKYGSITYSPPNVYSLKESQEEACPISIFLTNIEIFFAGFSDGGIGYFIKSLNFN